MFNASSLLRFFKPSCSTSACHTATADTVQELLNKEKIGILSASCCDSSTQGKDELLASNLAQAMEHAGLSGSRLYAGSWSEWCADPRRPMVQGGSP